MAQPRNGNDFDVSEYRQKVDAVHDAIVHPDKFADVFCAALETQRKMTEILKRELTAMLKTDADARESLKAIIKECEKEDWKVFVKSAFGKVSLGVWTVAVLVVGVLIQKWLL